MLLAYDTFQLRVTDCPGFIVSGFALNRFITGGDGSTTKFLSGGCDGIAAHPAIKPDSTIVSTIMFSLFRIILVSFTNYIV